MGRPPGSRSEDYDDKRAALAHSVYLALLDDPQISVSRMAERAGVTRPTIVHYFDDRSGAVRAALESAALVGRRFLGLIVTMPIQDPQQTLQQVLHLTIVAWRDRGVGRLHEVGIQLGIQDSPTAHCYLSQILDPLTEAVMMLLDRMVEAGTVSHTDTRAAAVQLLGPVVLSLLHQHSLGGRVVSPLDEEELAREHVRAFLRAYGV